MHPKSRTCSNPTYQEDGRTGLAFESEHESQEAHKTLFARASSSLKVEPAPTMFSDPQTVQLRGACSSEKNIFENSFPQSRQLYFIIGIALLQSQTSCVLAFQPSRRHFSRSSFRIRLCSRTSTSCLAVSFNLFFHLGSSSPTSSPAAWLSI